MKRNLTAAALGVSALLFLCGCGNNTGSRDDLVSPNPSASLGIQDNDKNDLPNNAGGTANNGGVSSAAPGVTGGGDLGTGTGGTNNSGTGTMDDNGRAGTSHYGNYRAGRDGGVDANGGTSGHGLLQDAGNAVRDLARGAEHAIRDMT